MNKLVCRSVMALMVCLSPILIVGCESTDEIIDGKDWGYESKNLVTGYVFPEEMSVSIGVLDSSRISFGVRTKGFVVGRHLKGVWGEFRDLTDEDVVERARLFDSMSVVYGDTAYNHLVSMSENWALAYPIDSIAIVSDVDYDVNHPAGSNLFDLVNIETYSYGENVINKNPSRNFVLEKKVSELTPVNRTLMTSKFGDMLYNTGRYAIPQTSHPQACQLTVTYFFSNGLKLSASAHVEL